MPSGVSRLINNLEDLQRALDFPWEKWTVFLHPSGANSSSENTMVPLGFSALPGPARQPLKPLGCLSCSPEFDALAAFDSHLSELLSRMHEN